MKYLSRGKLRTILKWAKFCETSENYKWSKWDANLYRDVERERKADLKEYYENNKHKYVKSS